MDALAVAAGRALATGDVLGALNLIALRHDPTALALRGIAMARLGELPRARELLRQAARSFGPQEHLARARCVVAEAEVALALRDLVAPQHDLAQAIADLDARADRTNAIQARLITVRRALLLGRLSGAAIALEAIGPYLPGQPPTTSPPPWPAQPPAPPPSHGHALPPATTLPASLLAVVALTQAELALRLVQTGRAMQALDRAAIAAAQAGIPALHGEVGALRAVLERPAARRFVSGPDAAADAASVPAADAAPVAAPLLTLMDIEALFASRCLVVDGCRRGLHAPGHWVALARRPLLFSLLTALAQAWPRDADRHALIATVFRTRRPDETHRARLRVQIGRLRSLIAPVAGIQATATGFALRPVTASDVVVIQPPIDGEPAALLALLADGGSWSTSALALAVGDSQRTVQRSLAELEAAGLVCAIGQARARRWVAPPLAGFTTILLLPPSLPLA